MPEYLRVIIDFIARYPQGTYSAIFFIAFFESLAVVGLLFPGAVIMVAIGAIISTGALSLKTALLAAVAGAVAGDGLSYWLGHHYKDRLALFWPFTRYPRLLARGKIFFHRYGGKSVFLARFVGPVRPIVPLVAGMFHMPPGTFFLINLISACGWAPAYILPGVLFGASLALAAKVSARLAILIFIILSCAWFSFWLFRKIVRWIDQRIPKGEKRLTFALSAMLFAAALGCAALFWHIFLAEPLYRLDHAVNFFIQALRTPALDRFFVSWAKLADAVVTIPVAVAVLAFLLLYRCYRGVVFSILAVVGGLLLTYLFIMTFKVPGPAALFPGMPAWTLPGGHLVMTVVLYGFISILLTRKLHTPWRWLPFWAAFLLFSGISFSWLYLGGYWFSDILAGLFLGIVWTTFIGLLYLKSAFEKIPKRGLAIIVIVALGCAGGWNMARIHAAEYLNYTAPEVARHLNLSAWWKKEWTRLPAWRIDLGGEQKTPLILQWAGSQETLQEILLRHGWRKPAPFDLKALLTMLSPEVGMADLPVFPRFHQGRIEDLLLVRDAVAERSVIRLWFTGFFLQPGDIPLFIGTSETEERKTIGYLFTAPRDMGSYQHSLFSLQQELCARGPCRMVIRTLGQDEFKHQSDWQGGTLLGMEGNIMPGR